MNVVIANRQRTKKINARLLKQIVAELFAELKIETAELGIQLVGAKEMARVNWQYLQHEGSTDVITFDHRDSDAAGGQDDSENGTELPAQIPSPRPSSRLGGARETGTAPRHTDAPPAATSGSQNEELELHGELFICVDDAVAQAKEFKTRWQSEVVRYAVHGVLHLLGHDDLKPLLRRKMKREENRLVTLLANRFSFTKL